MASQGAQLSVCTGNRSHSWDSGRVCKLIDFDCIAGPSYSGCAKLRQPGDERTGREEGRPTSWASQVRAAAGGIAPNDSDCILAFPTRKGNWQNMRETISLMTDPTPATRQAYTWQSTTNRYTSLARIFSFFLDASIFLIHAAQQASWTAPSFFKAMAGFILRWSKQLSPKQPQRAESISSEFSISLVRPVYLLTLVDFAAPLRWNLFCQKRIAILVLTH